MLFNKLSKKKSCWWLTIIMLKSMQSLNHATLKPVEKCVIFGIDGADFFGESSNSKIKYGLTSVESYDEYMLEGVVLETSIIIPFSECDGWGSGGLFDDEVATDSGVQCDTMSIFGKVMILGYIGTITFLIGLILSSLYVGYKNPDSEFWIDKYQNYRAIFTKASSLIPLTVIDFASSTCIPA